MHREGNTTMDDDAQAGRCDHRHVSSQNTFVSALSPTTPRWRERRKRKKTGNEIRSSDRSALSDRVIAPLSVQLKRERGAHDRWLTCDVGTPHAGYPWTDAATRFDKSDTPSGELTHGERRTETKHTPNASGENVRTYVRTYERTNERTNERTSERTNERTGESLAASFSEQPAAPTLFVSRVACLHVDSLFTRFVSPPLYPPPPNRLRSATHHPPPPPPSSRHCPPAVPL